jgi:hypothetical protein
MHPIAAIVALALLTTAVMFIILFAYALVQLHTGATNGTISGIRKYVCPT